MSRLIDADALKNKVEEIRTKYGLCCAIRTTDILAAPTVDAVTVVRGKWFRPTQMRDPERICSVCNGVEWHETSYCPNCGAKMEGGE